MSDYLTPEEARERLERGEVLERAYAEDTGNFLYRINCGRVQHQENDWKPSSYSDTTDLVLRVKLRVPSSTLADDLRELMASESYVESIPETGFSVWVDKQLHKILRKHGEAEE